MSEKKAAFRVSIPDGKGYVLTVLNEPMTRAMTVEYLEEIKQRGKELSNPRFLFDARGAPNVRGTMGDYEIYDFAMSFGFPGARIAVIVDPEDRSYDFTDTVACNAGYQHRLFTREEEAISWLDTP